MFEDKRSKKVVLVAHCILNQNAKIDGCAYYPGVIQEVTQALIDARVGIIQLPCPELLCLGLDRDVDQNTKRTIESEDTRVAKRMKAEKTQNMCQTLIENIVNQIEEYRKHGFEIVGLVGVNGSPTCGVDTAWSDDREYEGFGMFIGMLDQAFRDKNISISMVGIKARDPKQAIIAIRNLLTMFRN